MLWGPEELCKEARRARERENDQVLNEKRYDKSNRRAFDTYGCSEYNDVRVEAFCPDDSRWSLEHMLSIIANEVICLSRLETAVHPNLVLIIPSHSGPRRLQLTVVQYWYR